MSTGAVSWPGPELQRKLDSLWVDWYTEQVVTALRQRGVDPILLKGPAISRWLYAEEPGARGYIDADLLVAPELLSVAERTLAELGFSVEELPWLDAERPHGKSWRRADGAVVDLHRVPLGCEHLDPAVVWSRWRGGAAPMVVGGTDLLVPGAPARLLGLLLAVRINPEEQAHELRDLDRAIANLDSATWSGAAQLARELGLDGDAGYGLSQRPAGATLASDLGLPTSPPLRVLLEADPLLRAGAHLMQIPGLRRKLQYVARRLTPPAAYLREHFPRAAASPGGIAAAYLAWAVSGIAGVPRALVAWRRVTRARGG